VLTAEIGPRPPWSLAAIKTISYAENLAARRWARHRGADDLLWISAEGHALEAPTASLVWLAKDTLCTVPHQHTGILYGVTAAALLNEVPRLGLKTAYRMVTRDELAAADAIWLTSSLRGPAEVIALDGVQRERSAWTDHFLKLLGFTRPPG
jgi:4-amino-4-deoxychorismate lyase